MAKCPSWTGGVVLVSRYFLAAANLPVAGGLGSLGLLDDQIHLHDREHTSRIRRVNTLTVIHADGMCVHAPNMLPDTCVAIVYVSVAKTTMPRTFSMACCLPLGPSAISSRPFHRA